MPFRLLLLGLVIASNNLAVSLALGALGRSVRRWRIIGVFGVFEFAVPLVGIWLGQRAAGTIAGSAGWIGPTLLALIGGWIVIGALRHGQDEERLARRVTTWRGLVVLSAGLSLDNLVVGFSFGLGGENPLLLAATISVCSMTFAWLGLRLGARARRGWRVAAEVGAGLLLLALAGAGWIGWI